MLRAGMYIGDRYEIMGKIGSGGMSDVYKAKDNKLNRFVALKVLKQELSEDKGFVSKFRVEAQSAAGLAHPNIVNVYDVGDENGIYYIVMELIDGITLKEYIRKKGRLSVKETVSIAIQVSAGIEAAHNNHIIHRDIKPQNIIISKEGKVKVTDFGIAKAASTQTMTSNAMGSVHYTSPEQARGGYSDAKSDIYSLGITMYEMLTGRVPFDGDTTVSIALRHIQEEMPLPTEFISEIPSSLEKIIIKCTQKSPERRYSGMGELTVDLRQSLIQPEADFVKLIPLANNSETIVISEEERAQIQKETRNGLGESGSEKDSAPELLDEQTEEEEDTGFVNPKLEKIMLICGIVAAVIIMCIIIFFVGKGFGIFQFGSSKKTPDTEQQDDKKEITVPDLTGLNLEDAKKKLTALGLGIKDNYEDSDVIAKDLIIRQSAEKGKKVEKNAIINVYISKGPSTIELVSVVGLKEAEAVQKLSDELGLTVAKQYEYNDMAQGLVYSMSPEKGAAVKKGDTVTIYISRGKKTKEVEMPDLLNKSEADAKAELIGLKLKVGDVTSTNSDTVEEGNVMTQSYSAGKMVEEGTTVNLVISLGKKEEAPAEGNNENNPQTEYKGKIEIPKSAVPADFTNGLMRLELTQIVNGVSTTKTVLERPMTSDAFPFSTDSIKGAPNVTTGKIVMYLNDNKIDGEYNITFEP